jgi:hypothetical protein
VKVLCGTRPSSDPIWLSGVLSHERDTENKVCLSQTHDDDIPKLKGLERYERRKDDIFKDGIELQTLPIILFLPFWSIL